MNDVVFVLGAGASRHAGVPLMADFLDRGRDLWAGGKVDDAKIEFELVFKGITALQGVHSKADVDIHNVESVFSAFEIAKLLGGFGDFRANRLEDFVNAMPLVIGRTVEETMLLRVEVRDQFARPLPAQEYIRFVDILDRLRSATRPDRTVTILSFNYDMGLELALNFKNVAFTNGLGHVAPSPLAVLKLHGSVAWYRCECDAVVDFSSTRYPWDEFHLRHFNEVPMTIGALVKDGRFHHCKGKPHRGPIVVPPIWNKLGYHMLLSPVWAMAAERLRTAESVVAIGYSLPETDAFFRYLYALGSVGDLPLRRFWVFNPDTSGATERRFSSLLGRGAENRFRYFPMTFEKCVGSEEMKEL